MSRTELDDMTLARCKRGEVGACRALVERYEAPVFALLSRMVPRSGGRATIEDLAQETFLRVFSHLGDFDTAGAARLSTWILTIATRLAIDHLRRQRFVPVANAQLERVVESVTPLHERRALGEAISRAVMSLAPEYRAAFVLSAYHELSHDEIAQALSIEVGTVKSRVSRAKAALREKLGEEHQ